MCDDLKCLGNINFWSFYLSYQNVEIKDCMHRIPADISGGDSRQSWFEK